MMRTMPTASDLWNARKQTTLDWGAFIFMSYIFFMSARTPVRIHFTRSSGRVHTSETLACQFLSIATASYHLQLTVFL